MWPLLLLVVQGVGAQPCPSRHAVLEAEHARAAGLETLTRAAACGDSAVQRVAVRALGRLEQPGAASAIEPLTRAGSPRVRSEAVNALGQSGAVYDFAALLPNERDPGVRGVIYETMGRRAAASDVARLESVLAAGLAEPGALARSGAARGLESMARRLTRTTPLQPATLAALRVAVRDTTRGRVGTDIRELALLALVASNDRDSTTYAAALRDSSEQVRRVAVAGARRWVDDPSPIVRLQSLRSGGSCPRFAESVRDRDTHVALLALDLIGERRCTDALYVTLLEGEIANTGDWRRRAHATVSLARIAPARASEPVRALASSPVPQARAYAATAAKVLGDSATRARLARDDDPHVAEAAMLGAADAIRLLATSHAGLAFAAAEALKGAPALGDATIPLLDMLDRFTAMRRPRLRDARVAALQRLSELPISNGMRTMVSRFERSLRPLLADPDPDVATLAASTLSRVTGTTVTATTTRYTPPPFPSARSLEFLTGATAEIRLRGLGTIVVDLLTDEAPAAVSTFATLADRKTFDGLTFHRIVPNFVIQGGSPGANEYVPTTDYFMRDEVGLVRNARGTFGVSTRGRDTGDGQIYANLIDNYRLDHDYTVFARVRSGLDVIDRVQEGDVIESIRILRTVVRDAGTRPIPAVRTPAFSTDGRMVFASQGHLFLERAAGAPAVQLTSGSAWHRDPVWSSDGRSVLFASNRQGNYDLWRLPIGSDGATGEPSLVVQGPEDETAPGVAPNGAIAFVRGRGNTERVWVRGADGRERRLTNGVLRETSPVVSVDGRRVAFITVSDAARRVLSRTIAGDSETVVNADKGAERIAWVADPGRFVAMSTRTGVWLAPLDGRFANFTSSRRGDVAWRPSDGMLAIAEFEERTVGYNGDPDRGVDRSAPERVDTTGRLVLVSVPLPGDVALTARQPVRTDADDDAARRARNADRFDRVWERSASLYFSEPSRAERLAEWKGVRERHRAGALAARSDLEVDRHIHAMLRERPPLREPATGRAAVSSAHPIATEAGLEAFRRGGNVVDAAVAVSFMLGVVEPDASGIGGYGQMVIAQQGRSPTLIEFMSRVPEEGSLSNTSLLQNGRYPSDGPVLANVPGTVAGMHAAWRKYGSGKVAWKELVLPAARVARAGFPVSSGLATTLATEREHFAKYEGSRALFFRDGEPLRAGDTLRNPDLAWTLEQIAANGADGFYRGEVARKWVDDIRPKGNAMKLTDLARYFAPEREPVRGRYRDYTIYSSAPPVSGGADLVGRLNLLEQYPNPKLYTDDAGTLHAALSAWFLVPSSRTRIADPAMWPVDYAPIIDKDTARVRWRCFNPERALRPADVRGDTLPCLIPAPGAAPVRGTARDAARDAHPNGDAGTSAASDGSHAIDADTHTEPHAPDAHVHLSGTTAFTVADADGNAVAVTQTLGTWGGNFYVTPGLGFLSNDKLTSYGTDPSQYGARLPFARHGSTLAPTIAFKDGRPVFAVGAAGNAWITSGVYQALLGALDYGLDPQRALELPRFLPGGGAPQGGAQQGNSTRGSPPYTLQLEDGFSPDVLARLQTLGYELAFVSARGELREGYGAAIRLGKKEVTAGADPRREGAAGAIR